MLSDRDHAVINELAKLSTRVRRNSGAHTPELLVTPSESLHVMRKELSASSHLSQLTVDSDSQSMLSNCPSPSISLRSWHEWTRKNSDGSGSESTQADEARPIFFQERSNSDRLTPAAAAGIRVPRLVVQPATPVHSPRASPASSATEAPRHELPREIQVVEMDVDSRPSSASRYPPAPAMRALPDELVVVAGDMPAVAACQHPPQHPPQHPSQRAPRLSRWQRFLNLFRRNKRQPSPPKPSKQERRERAAAARKDAAAAAPARDKRRKDKRKSADPPMAEPPVPKAAKTRRKRTNKRAVAPSGDGIIGAPV